MAMNNVVAPRGPRRRRRLVKVTPKRVLITVFFLGLALVVAGSIIHSLPLYIIGGLIACAAFGLACICTDPNEFGRNRP
jgi:hypothetical protein